MKIIGIDPGLGRTGWAILNNEGGKITVVNLGCIESGKNEPETQRLQKIYSNIKKIIKANRPTVMAVEKIFFNKNVKNALNVGQARGVILLSAQEMGLVIAEYTPLEVKIAVTGYGKADKNQVGLMVKNILSLPEVPKPDDTADALAVALTHVSSQKIKSLV